jgi:hypothetical protein
MAYQILSKSDEAMEIFPCSIKPPARMKGNGKKRKGVDTRVKFQHNVETGIVP